MNLMLKTSGILLSSLLLAACGSDSDDHSDAHEEHAHSLLISQTNTDLLSVLEEGEAENLETGASNNGAQLLLADNGEIAAVFSATPGAVEFVVAHHEEEGAHEGEEEHELLEVVSILELSSGVSKVINSSGHFSVLDSNTTKFVPYESLEEGETPEVETVTYTANEVYPAIMLDEDHEMVLAFDGANAVIYEAALTDSAASLEQTLFTCTTVESATQVSTSTGEGDAAVAVAEFVVVSCDNSGTEVNYVVKLVHSTEIVTASVLEIDSSSIDALVNWKARADVFVGLGDDDKFYVAEAEGADFEIESSFTKPTGMCENGWAIDSTKADIFALTASELAVYNHEGTAEVALELDESPSATCDDLNIATANQAVFVLDNSAQKLYEIDKEEGAALYHIHGREDLSVNDVASAVSFHEAGEEDAHNH